MNRTIAPKRGNSGPEEQLDTAIYYCLNVLTKKHPPTEEFRKIFVKNMFSKPNTKAFIHVVHYLFNILDPKEFKKRFYWPIYDKNAENSFRTSTVEYVNHLIEKYRIKMEKIKAYTVVIPGGSKFMKFLLHIIKFVSSESLKRSNCRKGGHILTKNDIPEILNEHSYWISVGEKWKKTHSETSLLKSKIVEIDKLFEDLFRGTDFLNKMSFSEFISKWREENEKQHEKSLGQKKQFIEASHKLGEIMENAKKTLEPKEIVLKINEDKLKQHLKSLEAIYPDNCLNFREVFDESHNIDIVKLIDIVAFLMPDITNIMRNFSCRSIEALQYESKEISKIALKSDRIANEVKVLSRAMSYQNNNLIERDAYCDNGLQNKVIGTPTISINFKSDCKEDTLNIKQMRLALIEDDHTNHMMMRKRLLNNTKVPAFPLTPKSSRKKVMNESTASNIPLRSAKKDKMNALLFLNRIIAQDRVKPVEKSNSIANISSMSEISMMSTMRPEFSSTLLSTPEKNQIRTSFHSDETIIKKYPTPDLLVQQTHFTSSPRYRTIYSESLLQPSTTLSPDSILLLSQKGRIHNSPSGRIEPLVENAGPKIQLNNETVLEFAIDESNSKTMNPNNDTLGSVNNSSLSNTLLDLNFSKLNLLDDIDENADDLFDVSDGVLVNISTDSSP